MFTDVFNAEGLFTMTKVEKANGLNQFCKLEGMNYQQLVSEVHGTKTLLEKGRHRWLFSGSRNRAR